MRIGSMLRTAGVLLVAALAGLLAVQGTWALWNTQVPAGAQAVQAADFRVEVNGTAMAQASAVVLQNPTVQLTPTVPVHASFTVRNATNASAPFKIRVALGAVAVSNPSIPALGTEILTRTSLAPASGDCAAIATYPTTSAVVDIAKGASAKFCIRVALRGDAPDTLRGGTATLTVPVSATQLAQGS